MKAAGYPRPGGQDAGQRRALPFPWPEAIGFGLGILRLAPDDFWSMTPRELAAAYRGLTGRSSADALARATLDALLDQFPDT